MAEFELVSLQVGLPQELDGKTWTSGIHKAPVSGPVWLGRTNLAGDGQADLSVHGGPHKAVLAYSADHYPDWQAELPDREWSWGAFGENFTIGGLSEWEVAIGDSFEVGEAVIQVSEPRGPCWKLARRVAVPDMAVRVRASLKGGWYFRVLREGHVASGQRLKRLDRPFPHWTIARALELKYAPQRDPQEAAALAACPLLSPHWRV